MPMGLNLPNKPVIKPPMKLRGFNWTKIPAIKVDKTMWMDIDESKAPVRVEMPELCELFGEVEIKKEAVALSERDERPKTVELVDSKRSTNVGIIIARIRMTHRQVRDALLSIDETVLTDEMCTALLGCVPTQEEVDLVTSYEGDTALLGNVDQFFLQVSVVPFLDHRLQTLAFRYQFIQRMNDVSRDAGVLLQVTDQIKTSKLLKEVFAFILAVGNNLNGGTSKGQAYGFKIDNLLRLADTKTIDKKSTLLHFIARKLGPEKTKLREELGALDDSAKVIVDQVQSDFRHIDNHMKIIEGCLKKAVSSTHPGDRYTEVMGAFHTDCKTRVEKLRLMVDRCEPELKVIIEILGEDKRPAAEVLGVLAKFSRQLEKAYDDNVKADELERKRAEMEIRKREEKKVVKKKVEDPAGSVPSITQTPDSKTFAMRRKQQTLRKTDLPRSPVATLNRRSSLFKSMLDESGNLTFANLPPE